MSLHRLFILPEGPKHAHRHTHMGTHTHTHTYTHTSILKTDDSNKDLFSDCPKCLSFSLQNEVFLSPIYISVPIPSSQHLSTGLLTILGIP